MSNVNFTVSVPDSILKAVVVGKPRVNYKRNGDVSSFEIDLSLNELGLHKTCKSLDVGILKNKIETTLEVWESKYEKHRKKKALQNSESATVVMNTKLDKTKADLKSILKHTLRVDDAIDWESLKTKKEFKMKKKELHKGSEIPKYIAHSNTGEPTEFTSMKRDKEPDYEKYYDGCGWFSKMFQSAKLKARFEALLEKWRLECKEIDAKNRSRSDEFAETVRKYEERKGSFLREQAEKNDAVDKAKGLYVSGDEQAIEEYCDMVLGNSVYPEILNMSWKVNYNSETQNLVIWYELPSPESMPLIESYKFVKSKDVVEEKPLVAAKCKELYGDVLYQICIRTIHEVLEADVIDKVHTVAFNGVVTSLNQGSGLMEEKVIMSVHSSKEEFEKINLNAVIAEKTFEHLNGVAGKSLVDLVAVTPVAAIEKLKRVG